MNPADNPKEIERHRNDRDETDGRVPSKDAHIAELITEVRKLRSVIQTALTDGSDVGVTNATPTDESTQNGTQDSQESDTDEPADSFTENLDSERGDIQKALIDAGVNPADVDIGRTNANNGWELDDQDAYERDPETWKSFTNQWFGKDKPGRIRWGETDNGTHYPEAFIIPDDSFPEAWVSQ